jgi:hypothetical protein
MPDLIAAAAYISVLVGCAVMVALVVGIGGVQRCSR